MSLTFRTPDVADLVDVLAVLREWQDGTSATQLHPGDLGWFWRFGAETTAGAVRTWSRGTAILAVGLLDGPDVVRLAMAPEAQNDESLAQRIVDDVSRSDRGIFASRDGSVEARFSGVLPVLLRNNQWREGESWTPLRHDFVTPLEYASLRVEVIDSSRAHERAALQRAAFESSTFDAQRWRAMAQGPAYADAKCLVGYDEEGTAVAAVTVWSAGARRPGLLEPMGVSRAHRGRGYGAAITRAAAAALKEMGASCAVVCTPRANAGAVATYRSAGFDVLPDVPDLCPGT